ncbi:MAG: DNA polymerase I [Lentihominibacter sp.]
MDRIAIIDGNSLINRAYYAMRNPMITKDGMYTHAIFGFINMLNKIIDDYGPEYMLVAFDMKGPTFRHEEYDEYKAGRKKMPPELAMEIPVLKDILDAMKIRRFEIQGYEADDIIGTVARLAESEGLEPVIFTGDRDQLQLATDVTRIIYTKRGVSDFNIYTRASFVEEYGFEPLQLIDYKGLSGDTSDNIPGIQGVGPKTATKLIQQFGSVEEIIRNVDDVKPEGLKKKVEAGGMQAMMSKRLATIFTEVPLDFTVADCRMEEPDYDRLIELYKKLEFNRFLSRLNVGEAQPAKNEAPVGSDRDSITLEIIDTTDMPELTGGVCTIKVFGDNNHVAAPSIEGVSILDGDRCYYIRLDNPQVRDAFTAWMKGLDAAFAGHDLIEDYFMLMSLGIDGFTTEHDTAVAQYVLDSGRSSYTLSALSNEYLHRSLTEYGEFMASHGQMDLLGDHVKDTAEYGLDCCLRIFDIAGLQKERIREENLEEVLNKVELPLIEVMASMEHEGFRADRDYLRDFGAMLSEEIDRIAGRIYDLAGEEFNINSPQQLGNILFEKLELPHGKKTKRGYSTSAEVLEKIEDKHEIVPAVLEYRTLSKLKSTYVDGLIPLISEEGRIHAHFRQTVTATGRISCTEPNLQNIPVKQELGRRLRQAFVPEEGCTLLGADYSQIELRVLAHLSGDEALIDSFNKGEDIHRATASRVLGVPEDSISIEERSRAKAVNFGVIYGMSAFGLSSELKISRREAEDYIETYFSKHQAVRKFMDDSVSFCRENGYVTTLLGRKRYIKEINAPQYMTRQVGERLAMNTPVQGTAADIIKLAMIDVHRALREGGLKSKLILQIHDELIINTLPEEHDRVVRILREKMENACRLAVELKADVNEGTNWYELK